MMKRQNVRTLALIVCTITYLLVGAAIFDACESKHEALERKRLSDEEEELKIKHNITAEEFTVLRRNILRSKPYKAGTQWKFAGAFYFSLSVITTIGYGHSTPKTVIGKGLCLLYALCGIPLNIVMFQSIGERFNIGISFLLIKVKKAVHMKRTEATQTELMTLASFLCITVLVGGAAVFHRIENWKFFDAFYFCFITMSTIGFGDFVSLQNETTDPLQTQPEYVAFSILYILSGLTVFAAALNLMVLRLLTMNTEDEQKDKRNALAAKLGAVKVEGDVITSGGNNTSNAYINEEGIHLEATNTIDDSMKTANNWHIKRYGPHKLRKYNSHYTVRRSPSKVTHLLPIQTLHNGAARQYGAEDDDDELAAEIMNAREDDTEPLNTIEFNPAQKRSSV